MFRRLFDRTYNWCALLAIEFIPDTPNISTLDILQLIIALLTVLKLSKDIFFKNKKL